MTDALLDAESVLNFWFGEIPTQAWFRKDPEFDRLIATRFGDTFGRAAAGELAAWRETAAGALAEVLVLDQFSRNLYRDSPLAFAQDGMALVLAQEAIRRGFDQVLETTQRAFLYMPFMHSESRVIHEQAMVLFDQPGLEGNLDFERRHREIIVRFGRYPHRNDVLGRESTAEERAFLQQPGSSF